MFQGVTVPLYRSFKLAVMQEFNLLDKVLTAVAVCQLFFAAFPPNYELHY
jgi:hypothetical protein